MTRRNAVWIAALVVGPALAGHAAAASGGETTPIGEVVQALEKEARRSLRKSEKWPRSQPNYAKKEGVDVKNRALLQALERRLSRKAPLDGYIKWQLLSFKPDFSKLDSYQGIVQGLPEFLSRPSLPREHKKFLKRAKQQPSKSRVPVLRKIKKRYDASVQRAQKLNKPAIDYRNRVIDKRPIRDGSRLFARLRDLQQRYEAGVQSYRHVARLIVGEAKANKTNEKIPISARKRLLAEAKRLWQKNSSKIDNISIQLSGQVSIATLGRPFRGRGYKRLVAYLQGKEPES